MRVIFISIIAVAIVIVLAREQLQPAWEIINGCHKLTIASTWNSPRCAVCYKGYILNLYSGECGIDNQKCRNSNNENRCMIPNCIIEKIQSFSPKIISFCLLCAGIYRSKQSLCQYYCSYTHSYMTSSLNCKPLCIVDSCSYCSPTDSSTCFVYKSPALAIHRQLATCLDGQYFNQINDTCKPCSPQCMTCSSATICTTCVISQSTKPPACSCPKNQYILKGKCVQTCPYQYKISFDSLSCAEYCPIKKSYPIFGINHIFSQCIIVDQSSNLYCYDNVKELLNTDNISLSLSNNLDIYTLQVILNQTPEECYQIILGGINETYNWKQIKKSEENTGNDLIISFNFNQADLDNKNIYCTLTECNMYIRLFWLNWLQIEYKLSVKLETKANLLNSFKLSGQNMYVELDVPENQFRKSKVTFNCKSDQKCNLNKIDAPIESYIQLTQEVDYELSDNVLLPHSLKIIVNLGESYLLNANNYKYDNSVKGKITYTFKMSMKFTDGELIVISIIKNTTYKKRILQSTGSEVYPKLIIQISSSSSTNVTSEGNGKMNILIALLISLFLTAMLGVIIFLYIRKKYRNMMISFKAELTRNVQQNIGDKLEQKQEFLRITDDGNVTNHKTKIILNSEKKELNIMSELNDIEQSSLPQNGQIPLQILQKQVSHKVIQEPAFLAENYSEEAESINTIASILVKENIINKYERNRYPMLIIDKKIEEKSVKIETEMIVSQISKTSFLTEETRSLTMSVKSIEQQDPEKKI